MWSQLCTSSRVLDILKFIKEFGCLAIEDAVAILIPRREECVHQAEKQSN